MPEPTRLSDYFDQMYSTHDRYWWREPGRHSLEPEDYPSSLLAQQTLRVLPAPQQGRALDIGAGEGADAIRLALRGYAVDAVELSAVAATKIEHFAEQAGVKVNVTVADAQHYIPDGLYDVIVCNGVLHYIKDKELVISRRRQPAIAGSTSSRCGAATRRYQSAMSSCQFTVTPRTAWSSADIRHGRRSSSTSSATSRKQRIPTFPHTGIVT
jgi:SAM-dependent methyltransferase